MKMINKAWIGLCALALGAGLASCQPQTTAEKVKDKVEDAGHETGQAIDRAGEKVKDTVN